MSEKSADLLAKLEAAAAAFDADRLEAVSARLRKALRAEADGDPRARLAALLDAARSHDPERVEALTRELADQLRDDPTPSPEAFIRELEKAVTRFDRPRVAHLCEVLVRRFFAHAVDYREADARKRVLDLLRRKRHFGLMAEVAEAMIRLDGGGTTVRRQLVQALLDQGQVTAGLALLARLEPDCHAVGDRKELLEARGLFGRAHKQIYVDGALAGAAPADNAESLRRAIKAYEAVYDKDKTQSWHGINTVALLCRARRDGIDVSGAGTDPEVAATEILRRMTRKGKRAKVWDCATAVEACVALSRFEEAAGWATRYVDHAKADAFEYASTLRQLEEVWELDPDDPDHAPVLQLIREALLLREGGRVEIADPAAELRRATELAEDRRFELVLGLDRYRPFRWYRTGLARASRVAKIADRFGSGHGTGFVVPGDAVHPSLGGRWVLVTNAHVLSDDPAEQGGMPAALPRGAARISFEAGPSPTAELGVERILFTSPRNRLDFTLATLSSDPPVSEDLPFAQALPRLGSHQRVYVIGHPRGGGLSFSLDDNLLLDHEAPRVHYRAPTEGGSSGSPVFNASWELIALHHAGSETMARLNGQPGTYPANEGIAIQSIRREVTEQVARGG